jgi:hypothetical protein
MLEPVAFKPARRLDLDRATIDALTADYQEKLRTAFGRHLPQTGATGPGILVVRAAITDVGHANPYINAVAMAAVLIPVTAGGASTEAEVVDGGSGEQLAALQVATNGGRAFLGGPVGYLSKYGRARRAFTRHADQLATELFTQDKRHTPDSRVADIN